MSELRQVEEFRQALTHCWLNLCISIPGKRDMMMTPMDFYASITPDCNKFGVSGPTSGRVLPTALYFNENLYNTWLDGLESYI